MKRDNHQISIIIPTLNEAGGIGALLAHLKNHSNPQHLREILVIDGGSKDATPARAVEGGAVAIQSARGRAVQMNRGAKVASGDILYFLHADTFPPVGFDLAILQAIENGYEAGCFRMRFDSGSRFLRFFAWFTRFNHPMCRGGDQSLFVSRRRFTELGGFNEAYRIYEDNEFTSRLYKKCAFTVLPVQVTTSARRYRGQNPLLLQFHFGVMHFKNMLGAGPDSLHRYYSRNIAL